MGLMTYTIQKDAPEFPAGVAGGPNPVPVLLYGLDTATNSWVPLSELPGLPGPTGQPQVVEARMMVFRGGDWVPWDGGAVAGGGSGGGETPPPTPPVIAYHYYDALNQQLVIATAAVAPVGYQIVVRRPGGLPLAVHSLGQTQVEHRLSVAPLPGETITIELTQGSTVLSTSTFTFPSDAPLPTLSFPTLPAGWSEQGGQIIMVGDGEAQSSVVHLVPGQGLSLRGTAAAQITVRRLLPGATVPLDANNSVVEITGNDLPYWPAQVEADYVVIVSGLGTLYNGQQLAPERSALRCAVTSGGMAAPAEVPDLGLSYRVWIANDTQGGWPPLSDPNGVTVAYNSYAIAPSTSLAAAGAATGDGGLGIWLDTANNWVWIAAPTWQTLDRSLLGVTGSGSTWDINGLHWTSTGPWYNDQGWWATAGGAVLIGTGFSSGGGAALEFELQSGTLDVQWQNAGGEIITGTQVQAGSHQLLIPDGAAQVVITSFDPAQYGPISIPGFNIFLPAS